MNGLSRRAFLLAPMLAMAVGPVRAAESPLPMPASLASALEAALARRRALVMLVSLPGCPWCKLVRQSYLAPLLADGQPVIELDMQDQAGIVGFDGAATTPMRLADSLRVRVAPTVLFLGRAGRELAPRLTGVSSEDFYGAYLQERVDTANRAASS
jgi:thioredoxin-related protein